MPVPNEGSIGQALFLHCPECGSADTRQHYIQGDGACNTCGAVFPIIHGRFARYDDDYEDDEDDD